MLKLQTEILLYPDVYQGLLPIRGEFDLRSQTVTLYLAPVQADANVIHIGVKDLTKDPVEWRFPDMVRRIDIRNNLAAPDEAVTALMASFTPFLEALEQYILAGQSDPGGLATSPYQVGVKEWDLACTFETVGSRTVIVREIT